MHEIIEQQYKVMGDLADDIEITLSREFMFDGFIATSQVGDLALNKRLNNAIEDFIAGKSVSQGLDDWLFDISKARSSTNDYEVTQWQNTQMNEIQKEAVIKILSCPDVCLIQGPPGTGKTTVIAEAIYQFVAKNQRVLITSQANLAVDNALERIISNPKIRAIRLGEERKIDASVEKITENKVLESFYSSIVNYVDTTFLKNGILWIRN